MSDQEQLEQEQDQSNENESESQNQETHSQPQSDYVTQADFARAQSMQSRLLQQASDRAAALQAENERLIRDKETRSSNSTSHDYTALNERAGNGQFAEVVTDIFRRESQNMMAPLLQENAAQKRARKLNDLVSQSVENHALANDIRPYVGQLVQEVARQIGDVDPTYGFVDLAVNGLIGRALAQNAASGTRTPPTAQQPKEDKPLPPRVPTGRQSVQSQGKKDDLTESEKRIRASMGLEAMPAADWRAEFYAEGQSREYDTAKMNRVKN